MWEITGHYEVVQNYPEKNKNGYTVTAMIFVCPMVYNLCILKRTESYPLIVVFSEWLNMSKPLKQSVKVA